MPLSLQHPTIDHYAPVLYKYRYKKNEYGACGSMETCFDLSGPNLSQTAVILVYQNFLSKAKLTPEHHVMETNGHVFDKIEPASL